MKRLSRKWKWIWLLVFVAVAASVAVVVVLTAGEDEIPVQKGKVTKGELRQIVSASGNVNPAVKVEISANISAEITKLHVREGDPVNKGDVLVSLDAYRHKANNRQAQAGLQAAQAQVRLAKARLNLAQKTFDRQNELFAKKLTSKELLDAAETEAAVAEASLAAAKDNASQASAGLMVTRDELSKATIRSPMDGVVTRLSKEEGEIALGSTFARDVIMVVSDPSEIIAKVDVDEADVVEVEIGDNATIEIDALPGQKFDGNVIEIAGSAKVTQLGTQEETVDFEVEVLLKGDTSLMRPGMSATADIVTEVKDAVLQVPIQCVTMRDPAALAKLAAAADEADEGDEAEEAVEAEEEDEPKDSGAAVVGDFSKMKEMLFAIDEGVLRAVWIETGISSDSHMEVAGEGLAEDLEIVCGPFKTLNRELKPGDHVAASGGAKTASDDDD
jgi:HlyD family secretion protein